jgi:hypothetical protein
VEPTLFRFFDPTARALENVSDARLIVDEALLRTGSGGGSSVLHQACFDTLSLSHFALRSSGPHAGMSTAQRAVAGRLVARPAARVERRHFDLFDVESFGAWQAL